MLRVRDILGDILLVARGKRPPPGAEPISVMLAIARLDRLDGFELRRMNGYRSARDVEAALRRGDLVAVRQPRRRVVLELKAPPEPVLGPVAPEEEKHEIAVILFDSAGKRLDVDCQIALPDEEKGKKVKLADGSIRLDAKRDGVCSVTFTGLKTPEKLPTEAEPVELVANAELLTRRDFDKVFKKRTRSVAHIFQLARKKATVIELEHFSNDGAVFLPGFSPAKRREAAPQVTGIDALKAVFERAKNEQHVLVTGHHASLSKERAESVQFLLMGNRFAWAALSERVAKPEDKAHLRAWASEPLPKDDAAWTLETWDKVFDLYMRVIVPQAPPKPKRHKLVIRGPQGEKEPIYPVKMAEITFGWQHANRHVELEPLNPHICKGHLNWSIGPHDEIFMPETWPPEPLIARGFKVVPVDAGDDPAPVEPPHLQHAPRAVGCGDHHLEHPNAKAPERRAERRHAEVVILPEDALVCSHDGPCDTSTCEVYDPTAYEPVFVTPSTPRRITLRVWLKDRNRQRMPGAPYRVRFGQEVRMGSADTSGLVVIPNAPEVATCVLEWGSLPVDLPASGQALRYSRELHVDLDGAVRIDRELENLAYLHADREGRLAAFSLDYERDAEAVGVVHRDGLAAPVRG